MSGCPPFNSKGETHPRAPLACAVTHTYVLQHQNELRCVDRTPDGSVSGLRATVRSARFALLPNPTVQRTIGCRSRNGAELRTDQPSNTARRLWTYRRSAGKSILARRFVRKILRRRIEQHVV